SSRRRHTRFSRDWSSDVCSSDLFLGIDVGTSGTKALLVTGDGRPLESATVEYPLHWPRPGWAEQDAEDWWQATVEATRRVLQKRSEERRVGKECRCRGGRDHGKE